MTHLLCFLLTFLFNLLSFECLKPLPTRCQTLQCFSLSHGLFKLACQCLITLCDEACHLACTTTHLTQSALHTNVEKSIHVTAVLGIGEVQHLLLPCVLFFLFCASNQSAKPYNIIRQSHHCLILPQSRLNCTMQNTPHLGQSALEILTQYHGTCLQ